MFLRVTLDLLEGFGTTLSIFALTLAFALPLGLIICFGSMSRFRPIKYFCKLLVWIVRGTPLMLQLITIFYGPGLIGQWAQGLGSDNPFLLWLASWKVYDRFLAVIISFIINYACYFSEIYRGGIESIPRGQYEAGQVLGMTKSQIFFQVTLLQMFKKIVPPMSNEIITLVKDTSLARIISMQEVIWAGYAFMKGSHGISGQIWPLFFTGIYYLAFSGVLTLLFNRVEKKLGYFKV